jgi:ribonuclease P protein component
MLPRSHRLRQTKQIQYVLRHGRRLNTPYLRIYTHPGATAHTRIACVVGKSVDRSAVKRHHYQRWLRELARAALVAHPKAPPYDMVWIAQPAITQARSLVEVAADVNPRLQNFYAHQSSISSPTE